MSFECPQCHQMFNLEYNRDLHIEQVCEMKDSETQEKLFINQSMLTCIGNKRKLVKDINRIVLEVSKIIGKDKLNILDGFSGSTVVSRILSCNAENLYINDMEYYAYLMAQCFLVTPTKKKQVKIKIHIEKMNKIAKSGKYYSGFISKLYSPEDTENIKENERCFYTRKNANIIDTLRKYIDENVESDIKVYCLVPLLVKASIHNNTAGVFKGFYKDKEGLGCWGGAGKNALTRIMSDITIDMPIWNENTFKTTVFNDDINNVIKTFKDRSLDIIYLDPPYNQHPYGSNYFMLNLIARNIEPDHISNISGIPVGWNKSNYNYKKNAINSMKNLLEEGLKKSKYILLSYNNEGIIELKDWDNLFKNYKVKKYEIKYDAYKGSRNLKNRSNKVMEIMYLISK